MPVGISEIRGERQDSSVTDGVAEVARHARHLSHEARLIKSMATAAIEDGVYAAKRAVQQVKRGVESLEDFKDETAHYVKRQPFKAVALAAAVGLVVGAVGGWFGARYGRRPCNNIDGD